MIRTLICVLVATALLFGAFSANAEAERTVAHAAWRALKIDAVRAANRANHAECGRSWWHPCVNPNAPSADAWDGGRCVPAGYHSWFCYMGFTDKNRITGRWTHHDTVAHVFHLGVIHFWKDQRRVY